MNTIFRFKTFLSFGAFSLVIIPFTSFAQEQQNGGSMSNWRRVDSVLQEKIDDLDDEKEDALSIPVLFGVGVKNLTKNFGDPRLGHSHEGLDIMAPEGTPIVSPTDAVVIETGNGAGSGLFVTAAAPGKEYYVYMHLREIADIKRGDVLEEGDLIGYVGHTGNAIASAPHLHFEIRDENRVALDPHPRFTKVFDLNDKMSFIKAILADHDEEKVFAEKLVSMFRAEFLAAKAQGTSLPSSITNAIEKLPVIAILSPSPTSAILRIGSRGSEVKILQTFLINKGIGDANKVVADGSFGPITRKALIDYQASVGLTPDGVYGPKSRAYVLAHP